MFESDTGGNNIYIDIYIDLLVASLRLGETFLLCAFSNVSDAGAGENDLLMQV